jgi:hypothetical protein
MDYLIDKLKLVRTDMKTEIANTENDKDLLSALASLDNSMFYLQSHMEKERKRRAKEDSTKD